MKQNNPVFFTSFIVWVDFFNNARVFKYLIKNKIKKQVDGRRNIRILFKDLKASKQKSLK